MKAEAASPMSRVCATIVLVLWFGAQAPAAQHRLRVHPNPSLSIRSIAQGPDGLLWLAAADGLYRFDGFHYQRVTDYPLPDATHVAFTRDGSLWVGSSGGLLRYKEGFEFVLRDPVLDLAGFPEQVIAKLTLRNHARVRMDGAIEHFRQYGRQYITPDFQNRLWNVCAGRPWHACSTDANSLGWLEKLPLPGDVVQTVADSQGRLWAASDVNAVALRDGRPVLELRRAPSVQTHRARPLLPGRDGQFWFLGETITGTNPPILLRDRQTYGGLDVTAAFEDARGHLWAAIAARGLVEWIPDAGWERWFPEDFGNEQAQQVMRTATGELVAVTRTNLYRFNSETRDWKRLSSGGHEYRALVPLPETGYLASIETVGIARLSPTGEVVEQLENPHPRRNADYRQIRRDAKGAYWVGHAQGLFRIEGSAGSFYLRQHRLPDEVRGSDVNVESGPDGSLWVGYQEHVAWLDRENQPHILPTDRPLSGIISIAPGPKHDSDIWLAYLGEDQWIGNASNVGGRFARLQREGDQWIVEDFGVDQGYGPPNTRFIQRDSRGWIWRGSTDGVYVSDGRKIGPNDWLHIESNNGLATDSVHRYGFFEDNDGSVWTSGAQGVTHLKPEASWFDALRNAAPLQITRLDADGQVFLNPQTFRERLRSEPRVLKIDVGSLDAPVFRDDAIRYRLQPLFSEWRLSRDGSLEFRDLPRNAYALEVGYSGDGSSPILTFDFQVGPSPLQISWIWLLAIAVAGTVAFLTRSVWFERVAYRLSKALYIGRHWLRSRNGRGLGTITTEPDHTGQTLYGRYQVTRAISRGGFSVVYEARDIRSGNAPVAVKVLFPGSGTNGWARERFAQEVAALRSIEHPGVVPILDSWISPAGEPCLAMAFLDGPTLRQALQEGAFPLDRTARIIRRLGEALSEIHRRGIVHRDFKPENVILLDAGTAQEQPVIVDFGTAGMRGPENELAVTTLLAGSFHYLAPERLTGHYCPSSDIYAFGVIVLEMLVGKRLSDLRAMPSQDGFIDELARVVEPVVGARVAPALTLQLAPAYCPEAHRRPAEAQTWAAGLAARLRAGVTT
jgi:serine/threonine-protein kinase